MTERVWNPTFRLLAPCLLAAAVAAQGAPSAPSRPAEASPVAVPAAPAAPAAPESAPEPAVAAPRQRSHSRPPARGRAATAPAPVAVPTPALPPPVQGEPAEVLRVELPVVEVPNIELPSVTLSEPIAVPIEIPAEALAPVAIAVPGVPQGDEDAVGDLRRAVERLRRSALTPADRRKAARELERLAELLHRDEARTADGEVAEDYRRAAEANKQALHDHLLQLEKVRADQDAAREVLEHQAKDLEAAARAHAESHLKHVHDMIESGQMDEVKRLLQKAGTEVDTANAHTRAAEALRAYADAERAGTDMEARHRQMAEDHLRRAQASAEGADKAPEHARALLERLKEDRDAAPRRASSAQSTDDLRAMMDDLREEMNSVRALLEELRARRTPPRPGQAR